MGPASLSPTSPEAGTFKILPRGSNSPSLSGMLLLKEIVRPSDQIRATLTPTSSVKVRRLPMIHCLCGL